MEEVQTITIKIKLLGEYLGFDAEEFMTIRNKEVKKYRDRAIYALYELNYNFTDIEKIFGKHPSSIRYVIEKKLSEFGIYRGLDREATTYVKYLLINNFKIKEKEKHNV